jgi:hypothetical protein
MKRSTLKYLVMAGAAIGLAACSDSTTPSLISDTQLTADVAASTGDAAATTVENLVLNETNVALPTAMPSPGFDVLGSPPAIVRSRTCYDASNAVVASCTPLSSVVKIVFHWTEDGSRSGANFTGVVHRVRDVTVTRNFNSAVPPVEVSRTHSGVGTANDTAAFNNGTINRTVVEAASDSIQGVTWNLPRANNPFPISGKLVRNVAIHATFQSANRTETRDVTKRIEVDFPADAQGNVVLKLDAKTCNLNLVTHAVSNCQ